MHQDPKKLLEKYKQGKCSAKEKAIVESWYLQLESVENVESFESVENPERIESVGNGNGNPSAEVIENTRDQVWASLKAKHLTADEPVKTGIYLRKVVTWVAAVLVIGSVTFLYFNPPVQKHTLTEISKKQDIAPGGNKAFLTLADGSKISLTDAENGEIVKQKGLVINKTADGQLVYTVANSDQEEKNNKTLFNTIETPNGGKYQINLPDGTKVWLNAASSLRYPTKFTGAERTVELTGEGYFEVAKLQFKDPSATGQPAKRIPFIVKNGAQQVEVLGTHFNINSYKDEDNIKTTLLEGSVRVVRAGNPTAESGNQVLLKPGQQSQLGNQAFTVKEADTESVMAWKENDFIFDGDDLKSIMRKIARWYDVEVVYKGEFDNLKFGGLISRSKNISSVLGIMESAGRIHFVIEGKRVTVLHNKE